MTTVSSKFSHIRAGAVVAVPRGQDANRVRTAPTTETTNITAWLPPGEHAVILEQPKTAADYPVVADGFVWVQVYVCKAQDQPDRKKIAEVVGWTAAGKADGSEVYLAVVDIAPISR